jgi:hypothetical protein
VGVIRTDVSDERVASIFRVERISLISSSLILSTLKMEVKESFETSVLTRPARCYIPEDDDDDDDNNNNNNNNEILIVRSAKEHPRMLCRES